MSFLRRFSFHSRDHHHHHANLFQLEHQDQDRLEEINKNFTHRDADLFAPLLIKEMTWDRFNERILDCGCGSGKMGFTHFLPQIYLHDSHMYSTDTSESMVSYASMKYPCSNITYSTGDVMSDNFPFRYLTFDKIFSLNLLQCVKDKREALKRFFNFLKPGGQLGIIFATNSFFDFLNLEFQKDEEWKKYFFQKAPRENETDNGSLNATDTVEQFQQTLIDLGYEVINVKSEKMSYKFPTLEKAIDYYIGASAFVKEIPAELQDPFEQSCLQKMTKKYNISSSTDPYNAEYYCFYAVAKKPGYPPKPSTKWLRSRLSLP